MNALSMMHRQRGIRQPNIINALAFLPDSSGSQRVAISTRGSSGIRSYSCPLGRHMYCFRTLACRLGRFVEMRLFVRHLEPAGLPNQAQPVNDMGIRDERSRSVPED